MQQSHAYHYRIANNQAVSVQFHGSAFVSFVLNYKEAHCAASTKASRDMMVFPLVLQQAFSQMYRKISNNLYTLLIRTLPFSGKKRYFTYYNIFVHVKMKLFI